MTTSSKSLTNQGAVGTSASLAGLGDEAEFLARLRAGDEEAFVQLVDRYHGTLVRLAAIYVRTAASAEEVVQDVWAAVIQGLGSFEQRSSLKTWIFRILTNRAKTRAVRDGRTVPFSSFEVEDDAEPVLDPARFKENGMWASPPQQWPDDTPEALLLRQESLALVQRAIDGLPPRQRAVLVLRDIEGESSEDVCNILEINETNQRVLLHRARMGVRRVLEQYLSEDPK
jgi:RNA polymerase sigma-70 factor (ECF subfamily)